MQVAHRLLVGAIEVRFRVRQAVALAKLTDDRHRAYIGCQVFESAKVPASRLRTMSAKEKTWIQEDYPPLVICYLVPTEQSKLATLKKGQTVQLLGRCLGRVKDPSGFKDYVVVLDSCCLEE